MNDDRDGAERKATLRRLQNELFSLQNERSGVVRKEGMAEIEVKRLKTAIAKLEAELHDKEAVVATLEREVEEIDEEIKDEKKKMSAI